MSGVSAIQWRNLVAACAAVAVFSFSLGEMFPLLSLKMESWGVSTSVIGLNTAMAPVGILLAGLLIPRLAHRYGSRRVAMAAAFLTGIVIIAYPIVPNTYAWFVLRLAQGMTVATLFAVSEAWVIRFAEGEYRGRIVGVYASVVSASFGLGPVVIRYLSIEGFAPFVAGMLVMFIAIVPISLIDEKTAKEADEEEEHVSVRDFAPKAPMLLLAILVHAIFDGGMLAFLSVYGVRHGYDIGPAALLLAVLALGNVFFQIPIGWIADKTSKQGTVKWCFALSALSMLLMPAAIGTPLIWPLVCLVGAANFGIYTVSLALLGDRFTATDLVAGTAAFTTMWGIGSLLGSLASGLAMDVFGTDGFPYMLAAVFALYLALNIKRPILAREPA